MKKKLLISLLLFVCVVACAFGLAACKTFGGFDVHVKSVTLNKTELTLGIGYETTLTATVLPDEATDKTVTWTSEDSDIATVESGRITGVSEGTTNITATADGVSATCTVTVKKLVPAQWINIVERSFVLWKGGETTAETTVYPENYTSEIVWSVAPEGIVTINNGKITALSIGKATVTATIDDKSDTCTVEVTEDGIIYQLNEDGGSYTAMNNFAAMSSDIDESEITEIKVASEYNGKPVTSIGRYAFQALISLKSISIPASVTTIDTSSIAYCNNLERIDVAEDNPEFTSVDGIVYNKSVTENVFVPYGIKGVVTIPETMTKISDYMFNNRKEITGVKMHDGVTAIGESAFWGCERIHSITIPENMTEIGSDAFRGCTKLWEIYNLSDLNIVTGGDVWTATYGHIGLYALNILYTKNEPSGIHVTDGGYTFYTTRDDVYLVDYAGEEAEPVLPESYNGSAYKIAKYAFYDFDFLTSVTIPNNITAIGESAFSSCGKLVSVTISSSVIEFGAEIFTQSDMDITYKGTKEQWDAITKDRKWNSYMGAYTIHCTDGKFDKDGNRIAE
ncbi:MAG: leucine-rich repeat protein [Clostridia bacterium]|nr:leucine-rich repeat protein [Clostridia bacterium]